MNRLILFAALIAAVFTQEPAKAQTTNNMTLNVSTSGSSSTSGTSTTTTQSVTVSATDTVGLASLTIGLDAQPPNQCTVAATGQTACSASFNWINAVSVPHMISVVATNKSGLRQVHQVQFPQ